MKIVSMAMKSNPILQDKLVKQNEISRQILTRELEKLEKVEKSDIRMIETAWHRFRSRHKDLEHRAPSFGSNVRSCILRIKKKKKNLFKDNKAHSFFFISNGNFYIVRENFS